MQPGPANQSDRRVLECASNQHAIPRQAAILHGPRDLRFEGCAEPKPLQPTDAIIRVTEVAGHVVTVRNGTSQRHAVQTTAPLVHGGGSGLPGMALAPDFAHSGIAYVYYTYRDGTKLANKVAQDLHSLGGKILRMRLDGGVPADNPFAGSYAWSYGHRNPQGLAWNPAGQLFAVEHGQSGHDETNRIRPGANYGWPLAEGAARAGAAVTLADIDIDGDAARKAAQELVAAGHRAIGIRCDVSELDDVQAMVKETAATFGRLDAAFNNAGIQNLLAETTDATAEDFDRVLSVNLRGVWACMKFELGPDHAAERRPARSRLDVPHR